MLISLFLALLPGTAIVLSEKPDSVYKVQKASSAPEINGDWHKPFWANVQPLELGYYMGEKPAHFPYTQARLAYDSSALYVIFRVEDRYVRAAAKHYQGPVYEDSCVEFFFTPGAEVSEGYFNLEMNCGGTTLFHYQKQQGKLVKPIAPADYVQLSVAHSLPEIIDPQIDEAIVWTVEYRLPFSILTRYVDMESPQPGTRWRANFYKCADKTSHPHWLTWAKVDHPTPNFHLPAFFGTLLFE